MSSTQLYTIENLQVADGSITATVVLNAAHPIFEGHFPGQPVLPGACMLDMVKAITSVALGQQLRLVKADNLKFITPVDPLVSGKLQLNITHQPVTNGIKIKATLSGESPYMKMDGVFDIG
ncbi:3-hydroxyacyl-[acyl-carrier-protein] dehydratase [Mucilaginibacter yixingensis]|uniref:3-hydroxyacyl-[acyl-carrier-protein] dehydratase n=1 Tax=Mucilaginibacter yixingensis TaxID=1295612 RepID=A0A2T5JD33_9SPHI|nr:3-hydroxyacyl-ACP dehydratase [Mucilaginibacter yixingensis]PTQ99674.1 3-hydroxyacyl-[acyl-carrier-protein] dehydratase [Mucilaginibacter yixingensis]